MIGPRPAPRPIVASKDESVADEGAAKGQPYPALLCGDVVGTARAKCLTAIGRTEEGLALHRDATAALRAMGVTNPRYLALLADTCRRNAGAGLKGCSPGMGMRCSGPR